MIEGAPHPSVARLRWQCRRGMRELDQLLGAWLDGRYAGASERQRAAFCELLSLSDPELIAYLLRGAEARDRDMADVIRQIRDRAQGG